MNLRCISVNKHHIKCFTLNQALIKGKFHTDEDSQVRRDCLSCKSGEHALRGVKKSRVDAYTNHML